MVPILKLVVVNFFFNFLKKKEKFKTFPYTHQSVEEKVWVVHKSDMS